jgi:hypothetical protein
MDAGLLGKVNLPPLPGAAQFPDPLTRRRTDVLCHAFIIGLAFALYLAHTLFGDLKALKWRGKVQLFGYRAEPTTGERSVQRISSIGRGLTALGEGLSVVWKIAQFCALAFFLILLAYGLFSWMDESGWISHREETVISVRSDWLVGESKECWSATLDSDGAALSRKEIGYAMSSISCDDGPEHKMEVTFYGRKVQPEYKLVSWRCTRNVISFTCYQTGGER